ncbi:MAG TPA: SAM-dependent methyltransferase, partial [Methylophilus sp.]
MSLPMHSLDDMRPPTSDAREQLTRALKTKSRARWVANLAKTQVLKRLQSITLGQLTVIDGRERHVFGHTRDNTLQATIVVHDPRFYGEIAFGGSIGAGEAYMLGYWQADTLTDVV